MPNKARALAHRIKIKLGALLDKDGSRAQDSSRSNGKAPELSNGNTNREKSHLQQQHQPQRTAPATNGIDRQPHNGLLAAEKTRSRSIDSGNHPDAVMIARVPVGRANGNAANTTTQDHRFEQLPDIDTGDKFDVDHTTTDVSKTENITSLGGENYSRKLANTGTGDHFGLEPNTSQTRLNGAATDKGGIDNLKSLTGIDLNDTVDTDHDTSYAPAVVQETVKPHVHEIVEEQITRDIHTHDHYTYIQPVYDLEVLPARHFIPNAEGNLVEVSEADLPDCTGENQRWAIAEREPKDGTFHQFDIIQKQLDQGKTLEEGKHLLIAR